MEILFSERTFMMKNTVNDRMRLQELDRHEDEGREYLLLDMKVRDCERFVVAVSDNTQTEMAIIGDDLALAEEHFRHIYDGNVSPEHLADVAEDIRRESQYANI